MSLPPLLKTHLRLIRFSYLSAALFAALLGLSPLGERFEQQGLALAFQLKETPEQASPVSMVVLRALGQKEKPPVLREELAELLEALVPLQRPQSSPVVVDIALTEPEASSAPLGARIVAATRALGNVVHADILAWNDAAPRSTEASYKALIPHSLKTEHGLKNPSNIQGVLLAHPSLATDLYAASAGVGFINPPVGQRKGDLLLRLPLLVPLGFRNGDRNPVEVRWLPSLALAGLAARLCPGESLQRCVKVTANALTIGQTNPHEIQLDGNGNAWVYHRRRFELGLAGHSDSRSPSTRMPDVLLFGREDGIGQFFDRHGNPFPAVRLNDQTLLVVDAHEPSELRSPLGESFPQSSAHAQLMANVLESERLRVEPAAWGPWLACGLLVLCLMLRLAGVQMQTRGGWKSGLAGTEGEFVGLPPPLMRPIPELLVLAVGLCGTITVFWYDDHWLPMVQPALTLVACGLLVQLSLPRLLERQLHRLEEKLHERDTHVRSLEEQGQKLKQQLLQLEPLRNEAEVLERLGPQERATLAIAPEDLSELEAHAEELLATHTARLTPAQRTALQNALAQVRQLRVEVKVAQRSLTRELPGMMGYLQWYRARTDAHEKHLKGVRETLRQTRTHLQRIPAEPSSGTRSAPVPGVDLSLYKRSGIVTGDPELRQTLQQVLDKLAPEDKLNLRIHGETGTGKELVAEAIHKASKRAGKQFVTCNCATLDPSLKGSELFGHVVGAFTGATKPRDGLFVTADGGTLFLDEIGELSLDVQGTLLRVVEYGKLKPVGSDREITVNVRLLSATHRDLESRVAAGLFREDLLHRLGYAIHLKPLRERVGDLPLLISHFLERENAERKRRFELEPEALHLLTHGYPWLGNVRELHNILRPILARAEGDRLTVADVRAVLPRPKAVQADRDTNQPHSLQLSPREADLLKRQRDHQFVASACGKDPDYPGNRPTADKHRRQLIALVLPQAGWDVRRARDLLAGQADAATLTRLEEQLQSCLYTFGAMVPQLATPRSRMDLEEALLRNYSPHQGAVLRVVEAIQAGRIIGENSNTVTSDNPES